MAFSRVVARTRADGSRIALGGTTSAILYRRRRVLRMDKRQAILLIAAVLLVTGLVFVLRIDFRARSQCGFWSGMENGLSCR